MMLLWPKRSANRVTPLLSSPTTTPGANPSLFPPPSFSPRAANPSSAIDGRELHLRLRLLRRNHLKLPLDEATLVVPLEQAEAHRSTSFHDHPHRVTVPPHCRPTP